MTIIGTGKSNIKEHFFLSTQECKKPFFLQRNFFSWGLTMFSVLLLGQRLGVSNTLASSWFFLCFSREKALWETVSFFEWATVQRQVRLNEILLGNLFWRLRMRSATWLLRLGEPAVLWFREIRRSDVKYITWGVTYFAHAQWKIKRLLAVISLSGSEGGSNFSQGRSLALGAAGAYMTCNVPVTLAAC